MVTYIRGVKSMERLGFAPFCRDKTGGKNGKSYTWKNETRDR